MARNKILKTVILIKKVRSLLPFGHLEMHSYLLSISSVLCQVLHCLLRNSAALRVVESALRCSVEVPTMAILLSLSWRRRAILCGRGPWNSRWSICVYGCWLSRHFSWVSFASWATPYNFIAQGLGFASKQTGFYLKFTVKKVPVTKMTLEILLFN